GCDEFQKLVEERAAPLTDRLSALASSAKKTTAVMAVKTVVHILAVLDVFGPVGEAMKFLVDGGTIWEFHKLLNTSREANGIRARERSVLKAAAALKKQLRV